jgi:hydrogenase expression/formation protein HypC
VIGVLIHVGFAMSKINEQEARLALEGLQLMGQAHEDEVQAVVESRIVSRPPPTRDFQPTGG